MNIHIILINQSLLSHHAWIDISYYVIPYLFVFKPLGLIYEVGLRFEFKPPGAYKRNVLILHFMC